MVVVRKSGFELGLFYFWGVVVIAASDAGCGKIDNNSNKGSLDWFRSLCGKLFFFFFFWVFGCDFICHHF